MPASATPGMQPPAVIKPPPKPQKVGGLATGHPTPEFMWCQRSDRVYVTIKVADCQKAKVNISNENVLEFSGLGHGMCGQREYALNVELAAPVVAAECVWFVSGERCFLSPARLAQFLVAAASSSCSWPPLPKWPCAPLAA